MGHKVKTLHYPLKPLSSQAAKSHAGKAEAVTQRALNETMLPTRNKENMRRKILPFRTPSTWPHQYSSPIYTVL